MKLYGPVNAVFVTSNFLLDPKVYMAKEPSLWKALQKKII